MQSHARLCRLLAQQSSAQPDSMPAYKAMAYEAAARSGKQRGPEVDAVILKLQDVGVLLASLLLPPEHTAHRQLQGADLLTSHRFLPLWGA